MKQADLGLGVNKSWEEHWGGMPEYNNAKQDDPKIIVTFKFKNKEDFEEFNRLIKAHVFKCGKVFDGMQSKNRKQAWFPLLPKASKYIYREDDES